MSCRRMRCRRRVSIRVGSITAVAMARRRVMSVVTVMCSSVRKSSLVSMKLMPQKMTDRVMTMYVMVFFIASEGVVYAEIRYYLVEAPVWRAPALPFVVAWVVKRYAEVYAQGGNGYGDTQSEAGAYSYFLG